MAEGNSRMLLEESEKEGFNATLELHAMLWEEMWAQRPSAKILLLTRRFDAWYASCVRVLNAYVIRRLPLRLLFSDLERALRNFWGVLLQDTTGCAYGLTCEIGSPEHRRVFENAHRRIHEHARQVVPEDQLLVMDLSLGHGYRELCAFLDIPAGRCPDEPFPVINSSGEVAAIHTLQLLLEAAVYLMPVLLGALLWRCCGKSPARSQGPKLAASKAKGE